MSKKSKRAKGFADRYKESLMTVYTIGYIDEFAKREAEIQRKLDEAKLAKKEAHAFMVSVEAKMESLNATKMQQTVDAELAKLSTQP